MFTTSRPHKKVQIMALFPFPLQTFKQETRAQNAVKALSELHNKFVKMLRSGIGGGGGGENR
jgi:hypothetical protein